MSGTPSVEQRIERVRRAVSLGSAAIIRAYDEPALLEEACRILVEEGEFDIAWVAEAETGPERRVHPLAQAGADQAYLASLRLSWADRADRRHPATRAIREQRPQLVRDAVRSASAGLAAEAERHSYAAMAAFPLQFPPHGMGVLTVCSSQPNAFSLREMNLLRELAADIALGVATLREKTARDRLEEELEATQQRYRGIIDNAPEGILEATLDGTLRLVNRALARLMGYESPEDFMSTPAPAALSYFLDAPEYERFMESVRSGGPWPIEVRLRRKDATFVWASLNATVVHGPEGPAIECFVQDLTAARARREASARLAAIVDATEEAIIGTDLNGTVQSWNRGAQNLYGYEASEAIGHTLDELIIPDRLREAAQTTMKKVRAAQRIPHFETTRRRKNGSLVEVLVSVSPVFGADGEVTGASVTQHDITERKRGEAARRVLERQEAEVTRLSELDRMRAAFLSEASHEINTPLTTIRLQLDVLKMLPTIDERERASIAIIEGSVMRMGRLVKDMLDASGLQAGRLKLQRERTEMSKTVADAVVTFSEYARRAGVTIRHEQSRRFWVDADPTRAMQVLFNLLSNSVKFTPRGGEVEVTTTFANGNATVCVKDTGIGMTQEQIDQLFVPFGRLHEHVAGIAIGTGLGLFISKGIAQQHGGKIWASSEGPGKGSTFCFTLPMTPAPKDDAPKMGATRPVRLRRKSTGEPKLEGDPDLETEQEQDSENE